MIVNIELRLHPKESALPCARDGTISDTFPIFYKVGTYAYNGRKYKSVLYEIQYQYNYAIGFNNIRPNSNMLGYHVGDIERIMILHDMDSDMPVKVFLSAHAQSGRWFDINQLEQHNDRLVVYVALNSHRHFHKPQIIWRMFGFANDYTSNNGKHISMTLVNDPSIDSRIWNNEVMNTPLREFLYPLYVGVLPKLKQDQLDYEDQVNARIR